MKPQILIYNGEEMPYFIYEDSIIINFNADQLTFRKNNRGYTIVDIYPDYKVKKTCLVHRLVAETFLDNSLNLPCINHIDGNKDNNEVDNLEWISYSDNNKHAKDTGLRGNIQVNSYEYRLEESQVHEICKLLEKGYRYIDIINELELDHIRNIKNTISLIKCKHKWITISDKYDIDESISDYYACDPNKVHKICRYIQSGFTDFEYIMFMCDLDVDLRHKCIFNGIQRKKVYTNISSNYKI